MREPMIYSTLQILYGSLQNKLTPWFNLSFKTPQPARQILILASLASASLDSSTASSLQPATT